MTLHSDNALNLANLSLDLGDLAVRLDALVSTTESVVDAVTGPTERANDPKLPNAGGVSLLSAIYTSLIKVNAYLDRLNVAATDMDIAINGVSSSPAPVKPAVVTPPAPVSIANTGPLVTSLAPAAIANTGPQVSLSGSTGS